MLAEGQQLQRRRGQRAGTHLIAIAVSMTEAVVNAQHEAQ